MQGVNGRPAVDTCGVGFDLHLNVEITPVDITIAVLNVCIVQDQAGSCFNYIPHSNCVYISFTL